MSAIPLRPLEFGEVLDVAFGLFRRDYRLYMPLALVGLIPATVATAIPTFSSSDPELLATDPVAWLPFLGMLGVGLLFSLLTWAAVTTAVDARIGDRRAAIGSSYGRAFALFPRLAGAAILALRVLMAAVFVTMIPAVFLMAITAGGDSIAISMIATLLALAIVAAAGCWWATHTYMLVPAVVVEGRGPVRALSRSFGLARGSRWRVFFVFLVTWVMTIAPTAAAHTLAGSAGALLESNPAAVMGPVRYWSIQAVGLGFSSVTTPLWIACCLVLHADLRMRGEGSDLQDAARAMAG